MPHHVSSSQVRKSRLTELFALRATGTHDPFCTIRSLVSALQNADAYPGAKNSLQRFLHARRVEKVSYTSVPCDGYIEPLGSRFRDGFQIVVSDALSPNRLRFTLAHELCHTFFYEFVPEFKFVPHIPDQAEERLCNVGASELLMPRKSILAEPRHSEVSIKSLENLARQYSVSTEAMLIRLRTLNLWEAELSKWGLNAQGEFVCQKIIGARNVTWKWVDPSLMEVWQTGRAKSGRTSIEYVSPSGSRQLRPICFEMQRRRDHILILWGIWRKKSAERRSSLFD